MVYKKYLKIGGKTYGPYYYESYREDGKVKKRYFGSKLKELKEKEKKSSGWKGFFILQVILFTVLALVLGYAVYSGISGRAVDDGNFDVVADMPSSSSVIAPGLSETNQPDVLSNFADETSGGSDEQAGLETGSDEIADSSDNPVNPVDIGDSYSNENSSVEQKNETQGTGEAGNLTSPSDETISLNLSSNETLNEGDINFTLNESLNENISINNTAINETLNLNENETVIENISENNSAENEINLTIIKNVSLLRISKNGSVVLNLSEYFSGAERYEIFVSNASFSLDNEILNLTAAPGFFGAIHGRIIAYFGNESVEEEFRILVSGFIKTNTSTRSQIKVGEPVKWIKDVSLETPENVTIELPRYAENISVMKVEGGEEKEARAEIIGITGEVIASGFIGKSDSEKMHSFQGEGILTNVFRYLISALSRIFSVTGLVSAGEIAAENVSQNVSEVLQNESIQVSLTDNATSYIIEYTTPAPVSFEENASFGKKVVVSGPDGLNYTDVLSFTNISEIYDVGQEDRIKIYWVENRSFVQFDAYDLDENGKLDYVEWITPHLSNQTFEIILISKAEHLDANRSFVEDVYEYVIAKDDNWTAIPTGDYLRVTFEQNLTRQKDITIYARVSCSENSTILVNGTAVPCDIYKKKLRLDALRGMG